MKNAKLLEKNLSIAVVRYKIKSKNIKLTTILMLQLI